MKLFRFGVLGVSHFATRKMIPAMQAASGVAVTAIASRDAGKAADAARELGIPKSYGSYEELLADPDIDAVYNPLPNHLHVPWSERAAEAGKHVLCEKPIALDAEQARRLLAVRDRAGVVICEAAMVRLHPRWLATRDLIRHGRIGALRAFTGTFAYNLSSRQNVRFDPGMGGGVLLDTGFYPITTSRFCFDDEPTAAQAIVDPDPHTGVDRLTSALLRFPGGHALFTCGLDLAPAQRAMLLGTKGHIDLFHAWNPAPDRPSELLLETSPALENPTAERIRFDAVNQYTLLAEQFADAATTGAPPPVALEDSVKNMAVIDALFRSIRSGRLEFVGNNEV